MLRQLLETDPDPIDRHFQFAELENRLYRCRDLYATALDEFDDACERHDAEMESIRQAFMTKWDKVPLLETYRQMAVRQQKRRDRALAKLEAPAPADQTPNQDPADHRGHGVGTCFQCTGGGRAAAGAGRHRRAARDPGVLPMRDVVRADTGRGRKPGLCPECRSAPA